MKRYAAVTAIRLAHWRAVVASTPCRACGAPAGQGCAIGPFPQDCARCTAHDGCRGHTELHLVRFNAWLRPAPA